MSLLRKVPEGDGRERKLGEGTGNVKKYLATTMGRELDMRSWVIKKKSGSPVSENESDYPVSASRP
jgi:hypothetical protein